MSQPSVSGSLLDHFAALSDPRQKWRVVYPLPEILLLVLCATLSGMEDFVEIRAAIDRERLAARDAAARPDAGARSGPSAP